MCIYAPWYGPRFLGCGGANKHDPMAFNRLINGHNSISHWLLIGQSMPPIKESTINWQKMLLASPLLAPPGAGSNGCRIAASVAGTRLGWFISWEDHLEPAFFDLWGACRHEADSKNFAFLKSISCKAYLGIFWICFECFLLFLNFWEFRALTGESIA